MYNPDIVFLYWINFQSGTQVPPCSEKKSTRIHTVTIPRVETVSANQAQIRNCGIEVLEQIANPMTSKLVAGKNTSQYWIFFLNEQLGSVLYGCRK